MSDAIDTTGAGDSPTTERRETLRPALIVSAALLSALVAQGILLGIIDTMTIAGFPGGLPSIVSIWNGQLRSLLLVALPLSVGVLFSLWQIAPVARDSRPWRLIGRAAIAGGVGVLVVIALGVVVQLVGAFAGAVFFGNSFPDLGGPLRAAWQGVVSTVAAGLRTFVLTLPLIGLVLVIVRDQLAHRTV